jgi:hypothetical protein
MQTHISILLSGWPLAAVIPQLSIISSLALATVIRLGPFTTTSNPVTWGFLRYNITSSKPLAIVILQCSIASYRVPLAPRCHIHINNQPLARVMGSQ